VFLAGSVVLHTFIIKDLKTQGWRQFAFVSSMLIYEGSLWSIFTWLTFFPYEIGKILDIVYISAGKIMGYKSMIKVSKDLNLAIHY